MEPISPLSKDNFRENIKGTFSAISFTLISIIQGVALGVLLNNTFQYINNSQLNEPWIRFLPYSLVSFFMIIIVSYEYSWSLGFLRWSPRFWDTIFPITVGSLEIIPMFFLTKPKNWWIFMGILCFFSVIPFLYTWWQCKRILHKQDEKVYDMTAEAFCWATLCVFIAAIICILVWRYYSFFSSMIFLYWYLDIFCLFLIFICTVVMIIKEEELEKKLHVHYGLQR